MSFQVARDTQGAVVVGPVDPYAVTIYRLTPGGRRLGIRLEPALGDAGTTSPSLQIACAFAPGAATGAALVVGQSFAVGASFTAGEAVAGIAASGASLAAAAALAAGTAIGAAAASGASLGASGALVGGGATAGGAATAPGATLIAAGSLTAGTATGAAAADGTALAGAGSLTAGAATAGGAATAPSATFAAGGSLVSGTGTGAAVATGSPLSAAAALASGTAVGAGEAASAALTASGSLGSGTAVGAAVGEGSALTGSGALSTGTAIGAAVGAGFAFTGSGSLVSGSASGGAAAWQPSYPGYVADPAAVAPTALFQMRTTVSDQSPNNWTVTANDLAIITAPTALFGSTSGSRRPTTGSTIGASVAHSEAFNIGTGDFTIAWWQYLAGTTVAYEYPPVLHKGGYNTQGGWAVGINTEGGAALGLFMVMGGGTESVVGANSGYSALTLGEWQYIKMTRIGTSVVLSVNNVSVATMTCGYALNRPESPLTINGPPTGGALPFPIVKDLVFIVGSATSTIGQPVPTAPYGYVPA